MEISVKSISLKNISEHTVVGMNLIYTSSGRELAKTGSRIRQWMKGTKQVTM